MLLPWHIWSANFNEHMTDACSSNMTNSHRFGFINLFGDFAIQCNIYLAPRWILQNSFDDIWYVNIGSGNGLVQTGNKPLPEPMLTQISVTTHSVTRPQWVNVSLNDSSSSLLLWEAIISPSTAPLGPTDTPPATYHNPIAHVPVLGGVFGLARFLQ